MKREDIVVALLAGTSVVLVVAIVLTASGYGPLLAQSVDRSNGFVLLTGRFDQDKDAMYLIDERSGQMAVFLYNRSARDVRLTDVRDLREDFSIKVKPPGPGDRPRKTPKPD